MIRVGQYFNGQRSVNIFMGWNRSEFSWVGIGQYFHGLESVRILMGWNRSVF